MHFPLKKYTWIGIIFCMTTGVLLHFLFEWTGRNPVIGAFSPVNESVWEHLKLLFFPCLVFFLWEYKKTKHSAPGLINIRIRGLLWGLLLIVSGFYTYTGILGQDFVIADILLFAAAVLTVYLFSYHKYRQHPSLSSVSIPLLVVLLVLLASFILFTYLPLHIALFMDPQSFTFGIASDTLIY